MVNEFQIRFRRWLPTLGLLSLGVGLLGSDLALASRKQAQAYLDDARTLHRRGDYFQAARYAFAAVHESKALKPEAYSWITASLVKDKMYNAASYFFIKTLQSRHKSSIRRVLRDSETLVLEVGGDFLQKHMARYTNLVDYTPESRSAYLYAMGKSELMSGKYRRAIRRFSQMSEGSPLWPFALQMRGTAHALSKNRLAAIQDFKACESRASSIRQYYRERRSTLKKKYGEKRAEDLQARCIAGEARVLYEIGQFDEADQRYDDVPKASFVWTDILIEQAWNSFARHEYNRTLGKLVTYKSPELRFVFNSEVEVLRAQAYLALCLYRDANIVINEFKKKYRRVGARVKAFAEKNRKNLNRFYSIGKTALYKPLRTKDDFHRLLNRFVRSPYFRVLVSAEKDIQRERAQAIQKSRGQGRGFAEFVNQVLNWRLRAVKKYGGAFVKNSLLDYHNLLISDFEKIAFIKLEMLSRAKERLIFDRPSASERRRGNKIPERRGYQYYWSFNGEFWNDEIGDYVFGLESKCGE